MSYPPHFIQLLPEHWRQILDVGVPADGIEIGIIRGEATSEQFAKFFRAFRDLHFERHGISVRYEVDDARGFLIMKPDPVIGR